MSLMRSRGLRRLAREVELMLKDALDAYVQQDVKLAEEVIQRDRDIDQMYSGQFREFNLYDGRSAKYHTVCICISSRKISNAWAIT